MSRTVVAHGRRVVQGPSGLIIAGELTVLLVALDLERAGATRGKRVVAGVVGDPGGPVTWVQCFNNTERVQIPFTMR